MDESTIHRACRALEAAIRAKGHCIFGVDCWLRDGKASVHVWGSGSVFERRITMQFDADCTSDALDAAEMYVDGLPEKEMAA